MISDVSTQSAVFCIIIKNMKTCVLNMIFILGCAVWFQGGEEVGLLASGKGNKLKTRLVSSSTSDAVIGGINGHYAKISHLFIA